MMTRECIGILRSVRMLNLFVNRGGNELVCEKGFAANKRLDSVECKGV